MIPIDAIPDCLRQLPQWVCWKYVERDGRQTKCPIDPNTGRGAGSTDPDTWASFEQAFAACQSHSFAGFGFVFTPEAGFCGIDLDNCIEADTGKPKPWASRIVERMNSYAEVSPSGAGVKIFIRGRKPGTRCRKRHHDGEVEIYDSARFFTLTGRRLETVSAKVEARQAELDELYAEVFGESKPSIQAQAAPPTAPAPGPVLSDEAILKLARRGRKSGAKFSDLWAGHWEEHFGSQSEADSSVVFTLAFYTKDAAQIDRMFRTSGLIRPKWDEKHGAKTYGQMTIDKALAEVTGQYRPRRGTSACGGSPPVGGVDDGQDDGVVPLGTRDPKTGRLVLSPRKTLPTAKAFVDEIKDHREGWTLHSYAGGLLTWRGNRFVEMEEEALRQKLQPWLHAALRYIGTR